MYSFLFIFIDYFENVIDSYQFLLIILKNGLISINLYLLNLKMLFIFIDYIEKSDEHLLKQSGKAEKRKAATAPFFPTFLLSSYREFEWGNWMYCNVLIMGTRQISSEFSDY